MEWWFDYFNNNYYLNDISITKEIMDLPIEDKLNILQSQMQIIDLQNKIQQQRFAMENNSLATRNIAYDKPKKKEEPFIIVYKSRPIQGIVLELWGKNPEYNWEIETECPSNTNWGTYELR